MYYCCAWLNIHRVWYSSGPPEPVFNCTVSNHSSDAFLIACQPGFHGGLPQNFSLHFFEESNSSGRLVIHQVFAEPIFLLSSLKTNMRYKASIASINAKGKSDDVIVEISTQKEPERQLEVKPGKSTGPITFSYYFSLIIFFCSCCCCWCCVYTFILVFLYFYID